MPVRDHDPISLTSFLGTFDRGEDEVTPPGYFRDSRNIRFLHGGVETREGTALSTAIGSVRRQAIYKRTGEAQRVIILDNAGNLWDSSNLGAPILSIVAMTDFSMITMFERAYITPHNGITGLAGEKVYVYTGSGLARPAAGTGPTVPAILVANSPNSGISEPGIHLYGIAFETASGFITGYGSFAWVNQTGGFKMLILGIPLGPAGTVARHIVATKRLLSFDGTNFENQTYYFVPNGRIPDNTTLQWETNFYDADLVADATFLADQLSEIPAGVGIGIYRGRLAVYGENLNPAIVRLSIPGEPESHDAVEGFVTVNPGDSGGSVRAIAEYRTQLLMFKAQRSYVTQDNGASPAFWETPSLDPSIGTECHGVGKILDYGETVLDRMFVADRAGLQLFDGSFAEAELSYSVGDIWERINKAVFHTIEVVVDPIKARVYCAIPLDAAVLPSHVLMGDFAEGLSIETLKWTLWTFPTVPTTLTVDVNNVTKKTIFTFGSLTGNIYKLDEALRLDSGAPIDSYVQFPLLPNGDDWPISHFAGVRLRVKGSGSLLITLSDLDDAQTATIPSLTLSAAPGRPLFRGFNFQSERCSVKLETNGAGDWFRMTSFHLFYKILWLMRPEE